MNKFAAGLFCFAAMLLPIAKADAVTLKFIGTADDTMFAYTEGQAVSFTFEINDATLNGEVMSALFYWFWMDDSYSSDVDLWSSISGTGLTGSWVRPSSADIAPYSLIEVNEPGDALQVSASNSTVDGNIGLSSGGTPLKAIVINVGLPAIDGTWTGTLPDATDYFESLEGNHSLSDSYTCYVCDYTATQFCYFTLSKLEISTVPEPATGGCLSGLGAMFAAIAWKGCRRLGIRS
jgi:hypothetical protein